MKTHKTLFYAAALFVSTVEVVTAQTFSLSWFSVDGGGTMFTTGGSFALSGTIGQADASGPLTGGPFTLTGGFWGAALAGMPSVPGDCDADGDVDLMDYGNLASCLSGPAAASSPGCECSDFDGDTDTDLADWAEFQVAF